MVMAPVDAQFLRLGRALFASPADCRHELNGLRSCFDREAKRAMPKLLNTIVALPELPSAIRKLMHQYSSHLLDARQPTLAEQDA